MVLKELIFHSLYFGRVWWSWKNWIFTVSTLGGCDGLERTNFEQFLLWEGVVVSKQLIFHCLYFGRVWSSWKNWFWTVSTLGGCGDLERTDFHSFYFGMGWWSWKDWFFTVSTLGWSVVVLIELIFHIFLLWDECGGLDRTDFELTFKSFYFWRNVLVLIGTDFLQFVLWEDVEGLKELILNSFYFGRVCWSWRNWFFTVCTLGGCGGLERTYF